MDESCSENTLLLLFFKSLLEHPAALLIITVKVNLFKNFLVLFGELFAIDWSARDWHELRDHRRARGNLYRRCNRAHIILRCDSLIAAEVQLILKRWSLRWRQLNFNLRACNRLIHRAGSLLEWCVDIDICQSRDDWVLILVIIGSIVFIWEELEVAESSIKYLLGYWGPTWIHWRVTAVLLFSTLVWVSLIGVLLPTDKQFRLLGVPSRNKLRGTLGVPISPN